MSIILLSTLIFCNPLVNPLSAEVLGRASPGQSIDERGLAYIWIPQNAHGNFFPARQFQYFFLQDGRA